MSVIIVEHKCRTCKHFDCGDNECVQRVICLNTLNQYEVISDCDFWEDKKGEQKCPYINRGREEDKNE